ncbi:MAG: phosphoribosylanthranilate isomerase, partial [Desulfobacterales bacterium]|nr:phosphoribosylanthranilate isomerase [Desulfobacterales bacterium]
CQAIKAARPAGVDVSSGVEKNYGVKDLNKVRSFITRAKSR